MVPSPPRCGSSTGTLLTTTYSLAASPVQAPAAWAGSPVCSVARYRPSASLTSILSAPGRVPCAGVSDWAIHSCGRSKLTFLAGSVKVFQTAAVAPAEAPADAVPDAEAEAPGDAGEVVPAEGSAVELPPGLPAVQAGVPLPSVLQPASAAAVSASAAAIRSPRKIAVPVMVTA